MQQRIRGGVMESNKNRRGFAIKAAVLIFFIITAIVIARFTPLKEYITVEKLGQLFKASGPWPPVAFIGGLATVLYLRLVYFPFTPMNFGMGLTRVRFWDYFSGTALGIIVGTFIFTFFVGTIKDVWSSGQWGGLLSWKVFFSLGLFVFSFFIPKIIERLKASQKVGII